MPTPRISEENAESPSSDTRPTFSFPFMRLPLELRQRIYYFTLPGRIHPLSLTTWTKSMGEKHSDGMNLLASNREVSHEARQDLYGLNCFTVIISESRTSFLGKSSDLRTYEPFPALPSIEYIKNWQLALDLPVTRKYSARVKDGVLSLSEELAKIENLQTLKINLPCLCNGRSDLDKKRPIKASSRILQYMLQPLRRLHFQRAVTFFTALHFDKDNYRGPWESRAETSQCKKQLCLAYAASFHDLKHFLESASLPRIGLPDAQQKWLEIKHRATTCPPQSAFRPQLMAYLDMFWSLVFTVRNEHETIGEMTNQYLTCYDGVFRQILELFDKVEAHERASQCQHPSQSLQDAT
ncbi:MAG: hypothetical protein Q9169_001361 [Polycauliona sp. 2 TL-2023]